MWETACASASAALLTGITFVAVEENLKKNNSKRVERKDKEGKGRKGGKGERGGHEKTHR